MVRTHGAARLSCDDRRGAPQARRGRSQPQERPVIAVDTQILVFAHRLDSPWHERASSRVAELADNGKKWAIPMHCLVEFYSKATHRGVYRPPSTPAQAIAQIDAWLESPTLTILGDDNGTWTIMR